MEKVDPGEERTLPQRFGRYASITVVTAATGQVSIAVLHWVLGVPPIAANALATVLVALIAFSLSIRYIWSSDPARRYRVEMPTFFATSLMGLALSTLVVAIVSGQTDAPWAVNLASLGSYGVLWIARFVVLDRLVFGAIEHVAFMPEP